MYSEAELIDAANQLLDSKHTIQNCERLAAIYTVLDHLYNEKPQLFTGYSNDNKIESIIGSYGDTGFLKIITGKPAKETWLLINELIEAITVLNPRLISNFYEKLNKI